MQKWRRIINGAMGDLIRARNSVTLALDAESEDVGLSDKDALEDASNV